MICLSLEERELFSLLHCLFVCDNVTTKLRLLLFWWESDYCYIEPILDGDLDDVEMMQRVEDRADEQFGPMCGDKRSSRQHEDVAVPVDVVMNDEQDKDDDEDNAPPPPPKKKQRLNKWYVSSVIFLCCFCVVALF